MTIHLLECFGVAIIAAIAAASTWAVATGQWAPKVFQDSKELKSAREEADHNGNLFTRALSDCREMELKHDSHLARHAAWSKERREEIERLKESWSESQRDYHRLKDQTRPEITRLKAELAEAYKRCEVRLDEVKSLERQYEDHRRRAGIGEEYGLLSDRIEQLVKAEEENESLERRLSCEGTNARLRLYGELDGASKSKPGETLRDRIASLVATEEKVAALTSESVRWTHDAIGLSRTIDNHERDKIALRNATGCGGGSLLRRVKELVATEEKYKGLTEVSDDLRQFDYMAKAMLRHEPPALKFDTPEKCGEEIVRQMIEWKDEYRIGGAGHWRVSTKARVAIEVYTLRLTATPMYNGPAKELQLAGIPIVGDMTYQPEAVTLCSDRLLHLTNTDQMCIFQEGGEA